MPTFAQVTIAFRAVFHRDTLIAEGHLIALRNPQGQNLHNRGFPQWAIHWILVALAEECGHLAVRDCPALFRRRDSVGFGWFGL